MNEPKQVEVLEQYLFRRHWRRIRFMRMDMYEHGLLTRGAVMTLFGAVAVQINSEDL